MQTVTVPIAVTVCRSKLCRHSYSIYCSRIKAEIATKTVAPKRVLQVLEPNADVNSFLDMKAMCVCVCVQHFLTVQWAHCQTYIYGDAVIKLKQEHVAISQNNGLKNYRMRTKIRARRWMRCDSVFAYCKRLITKKCQGFW